MGDKHDKLMMALFCIHHNIKKKEDLQGRIDDLVVVGKGTDVVSAPETGETKKVATGEDNDNEQGKDKAPAVAAPAAEPEPVPAPAPATATGAAAADATTNLAAAANLAKAITEAKQKEAEKTVTEEAKKIVPDFDHGAKVFYIKNGQTINGTVNDYVKHEMKMKYKINLNEKGLFSRKIKTVYIEPGNVRLIEGGGSPHKKKTTKKKTTKKSSSNIKQKKNLKSMNKKVITPTKKETLKKKTLKNKVNKNP